MKTTIYMVRHAESPFVFGQERTRGLSDEGHAEAKRVGELLSDVQIDGIASSSYARAVQTVQYLAESKNLPIVEYEELVERPIKGLDYKASWEHLLVAIEKSFADLDFALKGGESTREAQQRAIPIIKKLLQEYSGKSIVIGTHGNIMTIIMNYFDNNYGFGFWNRTTKPDVYKMTFIHDQLEDIERLWDPTSRRHDTV